MDDAPTLDTFFPSGPGEMKRLGDMTEKEVRYAAAYLDVLARLYADGDIVLAEHMESQPRVER